MEIIVNGIHIYFETKGKGRPLIMLHGNGESHEIFDVLTKELEKHYTLYLVDSRNHGKSEETNVYHYQTMADDMYAFIQTLKLGKPALFGFSDGGIIGLLLAIKDPKLLSKLICAGVNASPQGLKKSSLQAMRRIYDQTKDPNYHMMITEPNIKKKDLKGIDIPTLLLYGSEDMINQRHIKFIHNTIKGSKLIIVEGKDHLNYVVNQSELAPIIDMFMKSE